MSSNSYFIDANASRRLVRPPVAAPADGAQSTTCFLYSAFPKYSHLAFSTTVLVFIMSLMASRIYLLGTKLTVSNGKTDHVQSNRPAKLRLKIRYRVGLSSPAYRCSIINRRRSDFRLTYSDTVTVETQRREIYNLAFGVCTGVGGVTAACRKN